MIFGGNPRDRVGRRASIRTRVGRVLSAWCLRGSNPKRRCNLATGFPPRVEAVGDRSPLRNRPDGALTRAGMFTVDLTLCVLCSFPIGSFSGAVFSSRCRGRIVSGWGLVEWFIDFSGPPQPMQQHRQLSCNGHDGSFLRVPFPSDRQCLAESSQVAVLSERPQDVTAPTGPEGGAASCPPLS